ncbi:MAG: hypothetical protein ABR509_01880 [Candidatus Limnocylindria bacterium]
MTGHQGSSILHWTVGDRDQPAATTCPRCGHEVPSLDFCVRDGTPLQGTDAERGTAGGRRQAYAAAPDEGATSIRIVSTLFPQLPRSDMDTFRWALTIGLAVVIALSVIGMYPVALIAAAVLVPLLMVVYLYDVDVYEDEPIRIIALTMAWGAVAGALAGVAIRLLLRTDTSLALAPSIDAIATRGVVIPLLDAALMIAGPLVLLRYRKFNDVLDGVTFGAASAVSFVGAQALTHALDLFSAGLRPPGDALPWVARLVILGIAQPTLAAGVIGAASGAFWLRYRAPVKDRGALGVLGNPVVATAVAAMTLVTSALAQLILPQALSMTAVAMLAAAALVWMRRVIHVGLLEEAAEIEIGPDITCANCGRPTPFHSFCGRCGVALRALPKLRQKQAAAGSAPGDAS